MKEQIEEMACEKCLHHLACLTNSEYVLTPCRAYEDKAEYRKRGEGCDFCEAGNEKCGTCVKFFDYNEDGGSDKCGSEYGNEKCAYYKPVHYCSNCGARMKGGAK